MDTPNHKFIDRDTLAVKVRPGLRADTEAGRLISLREVSQAIRRRYQEFVFIGIQGEDDNRWFIFKCVKKG